VVIDSLSGRHLLLHLRNRSGFEGADVLAQDGEAGEGGSPKPSANPWCRSC